MITIALPCNCGGKPKETGREIIGEILCIKSKCNVCGKDLRDCFEIKHIARFYDEAPMGNLKPELKRVK